MNEGQKVRTRMYLDDFKRKNGGCVICGRKINDYYFTPAETDGHPELRMYGSCTGHSMLSNSDQLLEEAVTNLLPTVSDGGEGKPTLVIVSFNTDGEDLKYAYQTAKGK